MPPASQSELLSTVVLRLDEKLRRAVPETGCVLMRSPSGKRRLTLTPAQAAILAETFAQPVTVPGALVRLVGENRCPPLREFYELVLQAHAAGILIADVDPAGHSLAVRWPVRLPPKAGLFLGAVLCALGGIGLAATVRQWPQPSGWTGLAEGWLAACAFLSLGEVLAACAVAGRGGEVRDVRLRWLSPFPHFHTDASEAAMGGRACEQAAAALRAAPVIAGALGLVWKLPGGFAAALAAALYVLAPWKGTAAMQWLVARHGRRRYSVAAGSLFGPVRADWWVQWSAAGRGLASRFAAWWLVWALAWTAVLAAAVVRCVPGAATVVPAWLGAAGRARPLLLVAFYSLIAVSVAGAISVVWAALRHWRIRRAWNKPLRGADARGAGRVGLGGDPKEVLKQVPLFETLPEDDLTALAAVMEPVQLGRGSHVVKEDDPADAFYVVQEGELEVLKRPPGAKRAVTIGWMGPGDCFGEIALLESTPRTATVATRRPSRLLKLGRDEFERLVLGSVGAARLRELLQHARYLGRLTFAAGWPFAELVDFARRCRSVRFEAGNLALREGDPNNWFFLIYDGAFEARKDGRVLRRMGPGEYFGEISLLENWQATADVVALEESRCLTLNRPDFLALFAKDFRIGLRMEAAAAQRLGANVFKSR